jgi:alginate O-acetyltransferase complex protein AlgI
MLLGGLWHGASWNFVLWGALHGVALATHKVWMSLTESWNHTIKQHFVYKLITWAVTGLFVLMTWIPFRSRDFEQTASYPKGLVGTTAVEWINPSVLVILCTVVLWHFLYLLKVSQFLRFPVKRIDTVYSQFVLGCSLIALAMFVPINTSPFIYFQF